MSEMDSGGAPSGSGSASKSFFTKKVGPLPMWVWMVSVLVLGVVYSMYKKKSTPADTTASSSAAGGVNSPGGVDASLVPQFVNQTYVQDAPPAAPNVTVNNTVPLPPTPVPKPPTPPKPSKSGGESVTVSGSPGSYTINAKPGINEWTSTGAYSLNTIAKSHGMTAQQLIAVSESSANNPGLKSYVSKGNLNAKLPAGVGLYIPAAHWPTH